MTHVCELRRRDALMRVHYNRTGNAKNRSFLADRRDRREERQTPRRRCCFSTLVLPSMLSFLSLPLSLIFFLFFFVESLLCTCLSLNEKVRPGSYIYRKRIWESVRPSCPDLPTSWRLVSQRACFRWFNLLPHSPPHAGLTVLVSFNIFLHLCCVASFTHFLPPLVFVLPPPTRLASLAFFNRSPRNLVNLFDPFDPGSILPARSYSDRVSILYRV